MNKKQLTLGSLFDGSGGFPLGGLLAGITPVWGSEIEPFPIRVTTKRLPEMRHYGDVSAISGADLEPVDIITFGSPCTDLSIAGKRAGLEGEKSSLFYEAIRIVKEMREKTNGEKPRYICWENVFGAFSSNKGEDFRKVLEEVIRIKEPDAEVPPPDKDGWAYADTYVGDGWSVAYRTLDAQYWGVPQRRRRIYLVGDLAGEGAGKILFESEGMSGYSAQGFRAWQRAAGDPQESPGTAGGNGQFCLNDQGGSRMDVTNGVTSTLRAEAHHPPVVMEGDNNITADNTGENPAADTPKACGFCPEHSAKSRSIGYEEECSPTLRAGVVPAAVYENHSQDTRYTGPLDTAPTVNATYGMGGNNQPFVVEPEKAAPQTLRMRSGRDGGGKGALLFDNQTGTLGCNNDQTVFVPFVKGTRPHSAEEAPDWKSGEVANTLNTFDVGETRCNELAVEKPQPCAWDGGQISGTLTKQNAGGNQRMPDKDNFNCVLEPVEGKGNGQPGSSTLEDAEQKVFGISSFTSYAMLSDNPHSGIYEAKTSRTLDLNGGSPTANQGGIAIVGKEPVAFTQNQRDEVCDLGEKSAALSAEPGMKQQTYIMEQGERTEGEMTAFHVNQRDEVIDLHGKSGALMATQNNQMQTFVLQGSMIGREDKNGPQGSGINEDVSFTLTDADRHAVCAPDRAEAQDGVYSMTTGSFMKTYHEQSPTLMARDYKDPASVAPVPQDHLLYSVVAGTVDAGAHPSGFNGQDASNARLVVDNPETTKEPVYTVRRLTPVECARLQGFPDWWCSDLGTEKPTDEEIAFWTDVFETHRKIVTRASKPKTEKQIRKWLADPYSDSAEYKLWGNGVALPCVYFVLSGIVWADDLDGDALELGRKDN